MSTPVQKLFDLSGRTALVTGGSRGLGLQIAEALGEAGARILLTSRKAGDLEESAAQLKAKGIEALWIAADASRPEEVQRVAADAMARLGKGPTTEDASDCNGCCRRRDGRRAGCACRAASPRPLRRLPR